MKNKNRERAAEWKIIYTYILWMGEKTNLFGEKNESYSRNFFLFE
jgi:hypothetical protein